MNQSACGLPHQEGTWRVRLRTQMRCKHWPWIPGRSLSLGILSVMESAALQTFLHARITWNLVRMQVLIQGVWGSVWESAFPTVSQVMRPMLLVLQLHFEWQRARGNNNSSLSLTKYNDNFRGFLYRCQVPYIHYFFIGARSHIHYF